MVYSILSESVAIFNVFEKMAVSVEILKQELPDC